MEVLVFVEGVIMPPPEEVPPTIPINETLSPLPRPRRDLPVGGRLAHFQKTLGRYNRRLMGPFCNKKRVQDSFYKETLSFPNSCFSQADRKSSTRGRGQRTPTQRGSGENKPGRSRILLSNFPGSQEKREIATYYRSVKTEFLSEHSVFQNGNGKQSQAIDTTQRLGIFTRFNRRLSPCTYSLAVSEIPPLLYQGSDIPIQGSTVRSSHKVIRLQRSGIDTIKYHT